ncbi:MAG: multiheme c-type cytochrome [Candidatus Thiodiazotropha sp.]
MNRIQTSGGWLVLLLLMTAPARAESLYLQQMAGARWDAQAFEETLTLLQKHHDPKPRPELKLPPFHQQKEPRIEVQREFCVECHTTLPHRESERLRSYLNMHVNTLTCTSCHFRPQGVELDYRFWTLGEAQSPQRLIAPYSQAGAETFPPEQPAIARQLQAWKHADEPQKVQLHLQIHTPLDKQGPSCRSCHTRQEPLLNLQSLDYDEAAVRKIQEDRIARYLGDESLEDQPIQLIDLLR